MLRHIVVCLKPGPENQACQTAAVDLALKTGAVLTGIFVRALPPSATPLSYPVAGVLASEPIATAVLKEVDERLLEHHAEQDRRQREVFSGFLRKAHPAGVRAGTITRTGEVQDEIIAAAQASDLVMLGRGYHPDEPLLGSVTGAIVRSAGRPVLVVPEWRSPVERIAVAYDGSLGADRALAAAADLAARWDGRKPEIVLAGVTARDGDPLTFLEPARRYLDAYDLSYHVRTAPGDPGVLINALALSENVGLLCMGAFGHSLLREALLGSTTQTLLATWTRALLLCH